MIKIEFKTLPSGEICGFSILGHSGYAEIGKDIVCAAVSSASYMVINTLTDIINIPVDVAVSEEGEMTANINATGTISSRDLIEGFKLHMISLESMYPENLKVSYTEV